jgi:phosphohistidine swiveling domain-containing protein
MKKVLSLREVYGLTEEEKHEVGIHSSVERTAEVQHATDAESNSFVITPAAFEEFVKENDIGEIEREIELEELNENLIENLGERQENRMMDSPIPEDTREQIESLGSRFDSDARKVIESQQRGLRNEEYEGIEDLLRSVKKVWASIASKARVFKRISSDRPLHRDGDAVFVIESGRGRNSGHVRIYEEQNHIGLRVTPPGRNELTPIDGEIREVTEEHKVDLSTGQITEVSFMGYEDENTEKFDPILQGWEADRLIEIAENADRETLLGGFGWVSGKEDIYLSSKPRGCGFGAEADHEEMPEQANLCSPIAEGEPAANGSASGTVVSLRSKEDSDPLYASGLDGIIERVKGYEGPYVFVVDEVGDRLFSSRTAAAVIAPDCSSITGKAAMGGRQFGTPTVIDCDVSEISEGDEVYVHESRDVYPIE